jgi:hypothetical protein
MEIPSSIAKEVNLEDLVIFRARRVAFKTYFYTSKHCQVTARELL